MRNKQLKYERIEFNKINWFYPKSNKITVDYNEKLLITSRDEAGYLIYGDNNGFENPPRNLEMLYLEKGTYSVNFDFAIKNKMKINFYLLLYNEKTLVDKIRVEEFKIQQFEVKDTCYFKIALKVEGTGQVLINDISIIAENRGRLIDKEKHSVIFNNIYKVLPKNHNDNYMETAYEMVTADTFTFRNIGVINHTTKIDWLNGFKYGRSYLRLFNGFVWLGDILSAYEKNNDIILVEGVVDLVEDWIAQNPYQGPKKNMAWHDETTALRLINWIKLLFLAEKQIEPEKLENIYKAVHNHAKIISSSEFYAGNNNHGMFQNFALLIYTYSINAKNQNSKFKEIAKNRLIKYFDFIITEEGVHKEHTPIYHYLIAANLKKYGQCFLAIDRKFGEYLLEKYNKTSLYSYHILKPDGYFPQIGDNENNKPSNLGYKSLYEDEHYKYAVFSGTKGTPPVDNNIVFKKSGYAIFRDSWTKKEKSTYLLFNAAYHTDYHKHSDDLSFILYSDGDIFIDTGPYGYEYNDPFTKYGYSSFAHNTLIVDNQGLPRVDNKYKDTKIISYELNENYSKVTGINQRYSDVSHKRTIVYNNKQKVEILDIIESNNEHKYDLLFHFAQDITPILYDENVYLYRDHLMIGKIEFKSNQEYSKDLIKGNCENDIMGWHFGKFKTKNKIFCLKISSRAMKVELETKIDLFTEKELGKINKKFIPYYEFTTTNKNVNVCIEYSNLLLEESMYTPSRGRIPMKIDFSNFDWSYYPVNENSYKFRIHTLEGLEHLAKAFNRLGKSKYIDKGIEIFQSWFNNNNFVNYSNNRWSYYDQGTALRVLNLIEFIKAYEESDIKDNSFEDLLFSFFIEHKILLESNEFYKENNNHGMFQDVALISIVLKFPTLDKKQSTLKIGLNRLYTQIRNTISIDGVHKEHSPEYQLQIYNFLYKIMIWLEQNNFDIAKDIRLRVNKMPEFFAYMLKPDFTLPLFGDTTDRVINSKDIYNYESYPMLVNIFNNGKKGIAPSKNKVYKEAGYYVLRNTLDPKNQIYMSGIVNFNSQVHKHPDNLSFELFGYGKNIIVDSGKYSYSASKERSYMLSTLAHNTLLVNDSNMPLKNSNIGKSAINYFFEDENGAIIKMYNKCYDLVTHNREINFLNSGEIQLTDKVYSDNSVQNKYSLLFHVSPDFLIKEVTSNSVCLMSTDNSIKVIISQDNDKSSLEIEDSIFSNSNYLAIENKLIKFNVEASDFEFITNINIIKL